MMSTMINIHDILDNVMIQAVDKGNEYWIRKILNLIIHYKNRNIRLRIHLSLQMENIYPVVLLKTETKL